MGTNYYANIDRNKTKLSATEIEVLEYEPELSNPDDFLIHLGKSSSGWRFSLHVYPEIGIMNWNDVLNKIVLNSIEILDEYGDAIPVQDFIRIATDRKSHKAEFPIKVCPRGKRLGEWIEVWSDDEYFEQTGYRLDKHGLNIHPIDRDHCIGNGSENETFDYIVGNFSWTDTWRKDISIIERQTVYLFALMKTISITIMRKKQWNWIKSMLEVVLDLGLRYQKNTTTTLKV